MELATRRNMLLAGAATVAVAGCTQAQTDAFAQQLADIIQKVQAAVVAACATAGKFVPTATTVLDVLVGLVGQLTGSAALATITTTIIQQATSLIAAACPATPPAGGKRASGTVNANGKTVVVNWY